MLFLLISLFVIVIVIADCLLLSYYAYDTFYERTEKRCDGCKNQKICNELQVFCAESIGAFMDKREINFYNIENYNELIDEKVQEALDNISLN